MAEPVRAARLVGEAEAQGRLPSGLTTSLTTSLTTGQAGDSPPPDASEQVSEEEEIVFKPSCRPTPQPAAAKRQVAGQLGHGGADATADPRATVGERRSQAGTEGEHHAGGAGYGGADGMADPRTLGGERRAEAGTNAAHSPGPGTPGSAREAEGASQTELAKFKLRDWLEKRCFPQYTLLQERVPPTEAHTLAPTFRCRVSLMGRDLGVEGEGARKQDAEKAAAGRVLTLLSQNLSANGHHKAVLNEWTRNLFEPKYHHEVVDPEHSVQNQFSCRLELFGKVRALSLSLSLSLSLAL